MANVFKYLTGTPSRKAIKRGNLARGIGTEEYGPTSETGYYAGVTPPPGGYVITTIRPNGEPSYQVAEAEIDLVNFANNMGANITTPTEAKTYLTNRENTILQDSVTLHLESSNTSSYDGIGDVWYDLSGNQYHVILKNNVTFSPTTLSGSRAINLNYLSNYTSTNFPYISSQPGGSINFAKTNGTIYGETDPCSGPVTFEMALAHAHNLGARLPTLDEVQNQNAVSGTGCSYDYELVWTIDKANSDGTQRWVTAGDPGRLGESDYGGDNEARNITDLAYVRMIADSNILRPDPVTITNDSIIYNYLSSNYIFDNLTENTQGLSALNFDGIDDYGYIKKLTYGGGKTISELTLLIWMRTYFNDGGLSDDGAYNASQWSFLDFDRSENFNFYIEGGGQLKFSGNSTDTGGFPSYYDIGSGRGTLFNEGEWHQVGVTFSVPNQTIKFYGDGILLKTHTANGSMSNLGAGSQRYGFVGDGSEASTEDGGRNNQYYRGNLDSILFYDNKSFTDSEVLENYNQTKSKYIIN